MVTVASYPKTPAPPIAHGEPPAKASIHATEWSSALQQNIIPELNEELGVTAEEFHFCESKLHLI